MYADAELWLSAVTGIPLDRVERVIESLQPGGYNLIDFIEIPGDPLDGTAELVLHERDPHPVEPFLEGLADDAEGPALPALGDLPSVALPGTGWARGRGEYQRPSSSQALVTIAEARRTDVHDHPDLDLRSVFWMGARGVDYHRAAMATQKVGRWAWLELVPEPHNPHDDTAVALDLDGVRIGYVGASVAYRIHPVVRYQNLDGNACFVPAVLQSRDEVYVALPTQSRLNRYIDRVQISLECAAVWDALSPDLRHAISDANYWLDETTAAAVIQLRVHAPHLAWPAKPNPAEIPKYWDELMRDKRRARREERAAERKQERQATAQRVAERAFQREQRDARIVDLHGNGRSRAQIAAELGVSSSTVATVLAKAGIRATGGMNDYSRAAQEARIRRCQQALSLQRSALTRAEIAHAMGVSAETVKLLLRDARFYQAPEDSPERLNLAVLAHHHSWTRAALDGESARTRRAIADAHALESLRPDLLES